jgi:hypothetical protein
VNVGKFVKEHEIQGQFSESVGSSIAVAATRRCGNGELAGESASRRNGSKELQPFSMLASRSSISIWLTYVSKEAGQAKQRVRYSQKRKPKTVVTGDAINVFV